MVQVAATPSYDETWADPALVALLSAGTFTWTAADPWTATLAYPTGSNVLAGAGPYGGTIYTAIVDNGIGTPGPLDPGQTGWKLNEQATADNLVVIIATTSATWLLDTLTQGRLHGDECWLERYQVNVCDIRLRRGPVASITSVVRTDACTPIGTPGGVAINWCWKSSQTINVCNDCTFSEFLCGCNANVVEIVYGIGSNLPPGTKAITGWLATEYGKAAQGKACALPERITNVTRQGVSWTLLDPQDFLDKKLTGMARVDNWLNAVRLTLGGTYIDPLTSNRLFSVPCP